jgi:hypothetical protein
MLCGSITPNTIDVRVPPMKAVQSIEKSRRADLPALAVFGSN